MRGATLRTRRGERSEADDQELGITATQRQLTDGQAISKCELVLMRIAMHSSRSFERNSLRADLSGRKVCITKGALAGFTGYVVRNEYSSRWLVKLDACGEGMYCVVAEDMLKLLPGDELPAASE